MDDKDSFVKKALKEQFEEEKENKIDGKKNESFLFSIWRRVSSGLKNNENEENKEEISPAAEASEEKQEADVSYEKTEAPEALQRIYFGALDTEIRLDKSVSIDSLFDEMDDYLRKNTDELMYIMADFDAAAVNFIKKRSEMLKASRNMLSKQKEAISRKIKEAQQMENKAEEKEKSLLEEIEGLKKESDADDNIKSPQQKQQQQELIKEKEEALQKIQNEKKKAKDEAESLMKSRDSLSRLDISPSVDGIIHIAVTKDKSRAYAVVFPPCNEGSFVTSDAIRAEFAKKKIVYGLSENTIESLAAKENSAKIYLAAAGVNSVKGMDGSVTELYSHDIGAPVFVENAQGVIDFNNLNWIVHIEKDSIICQITKAQPGKDGIDVYGKPIKAQPGKKPTIPMGENTYISEDGTAMLSRISGQITYKNGKCEVSNIIIIPGNVDYSVGNLDVKGDVVIKGNVLAGFSVRATGNVTIGGLVEGAHVISGGSIIVNRGINGNMVGNLHAKEDIHCKFMENASAQADGNIYASSMVNCSAAANGRVIVKNGLGAIIGGNTVAMCGIEADAIGNKAGRLTVLSIDVTPQFTKKKYYVRKELENIQHSLQEAEAEERMGRGTLALKVLKMKEQKLIEKQEELQKIENDVNLGYISAAKVYPITQVFFGSVNTTVLEMQTSCKFVYDAKIGKIV